MKSSPSKSRRGHSCFSVNVGGNPEDPHYRYQRQRATCQCLPRSKTALLNASAIAKELERDVSDLEWYVQATQKFNCYLDCGQLIMEKRLDSNQMEDMLHEFTQSFVLCRDCGNPETRINPIKESCIMTCRSCGGSSDLYKCTNSKNLPYVISMMKSSESVSDIVSRYFYRYPNAETDEVIDYLREIQSDFYLQDHHIITALFDSIVSQKRFKKDVMQCHELLKAFSTSRTARTTVMQLLFTKTKLLLFQQLSLYLMKKQVIGLEDFESFLQHHPTILLKSHDFMDYLHQLF